MGQELLRMSAKERRRMIVMQQVESNGTALVDDATGATMVHIDQQETTAGGWTTLWRSSIAIDPCGSGK